MQTRFNRFLSTAMLSAPLGFSMFGASVAWAEQHIGLSLPLSGPAAKLARQFETGAKLALDAHNAAATQSVKLTIADDGCDEEIAKLAIDELSMAKPQIITGFLCNTVAIQFAETFRETGTPLLIAGAQSERLIKDRERNEWNLWRLAPGDSEAAQAAVDFFSIVWANKPYAIVDDGTVYGRNLADTFRAGMEEAGLPPQFQDNFRPTQSTQARMVRRLRRAGVTHAFVGASAEDVAMIARNAEELEIDLELGSGEALSIFPFLDVDLLPDGSLTAVLRSAEVDADIPSSLQSALDEMDLQAEPYVLTGYQAMEVALQALADTAEQTSKNLQQSQFETLLGAVNFSEDGDNQEPQFSPYRWRNRSFERIEE